MRLVYPEQRLDCLPIPEVTLNLNCRDEIIPILRGLQHLYSNASLRRQLLTLVGKDVNQKTSRKYGRRGMNYWEIAVLAAVRLGCNLDYDKLQDLAEKLTGGMMGIACGLLLIWFYGRQSTEGGNLPVE